MPASLPTSFPACLPALPALPARSYMVILRHGGVYADVESECRQSLDALLHSKDTLVAGWDNEWANATAALEAGWVLVLHCASPLVVKCSAWL